MKKICLLCVVFIGTSCAFPKEEHKKELIDFVAQELNVNNDHLNYAEPVKEEIKEEKVFVINENLEKEAYKIGYKNGQNAMLKQMGKPVEEEEVDTQFMVFKEMPEKESEEYKKIIQKGYVDGYHKASEDSTCPRKDY
jgi:hypothetical protein